MATQIAEPSQQAPKTGTSYVFFFGAGKADGSKDMKAELVARAPGWRR